MPRKLINYTLLAAGVLALTLLLSFNQRDRRFETFIHDLENLNDEMVKLITDDPTPAGVAEARRVLDARKDGLRARLAELKAMTAGQAGGEKLSLVDECLKRTSVKLSDTFALELSRRQQVLARLEDVKLDTREKDVENARKENEQFVKEMELLLDDYESIIY